MLYSGERNEDHGLSTAGATHGSPAKQLPVRKNMRFPGYNYAQSGAYFVTICTADRKNLFGRTNGDRCELSWRGISATQLWQEIPSHFHHVEVDEFVVMPNHMHGLLMFMPFCPLPNSTKQREGSGPARGSLGAVISQFKAAVSRQCSAKDPTLKEIWQRNYHDHIVRGEEDLAQLREYILHNPLALSIDKRAGNPWVAPAVRPHVNLEPNTNAGATHRSPALPATEDNRSCC